VSPSDADLLARLKADRGGALVRACLPAERALLAQRLRRLAESCLGSDPRLAERAARAAARAGPARGVAAARAAHLLGRALLARGRHREAAEVLQRAARTFSRCADRPAEAATRLALVAAHALCGEDARALRAAERARRLFEVAGDAVGVAKVNVNVANLHHRQDRPGRAVEAYRRAAATFHRHGLRAEAAAVSLNLGNVLSLLDASAAAEQAYLDARRDLRDFGRGADAAQADYNLAYLWFLQGRHGEALEAFAGLRATFEQLGDQVHVGLCQLDGAEVLLQVGLLPEARAESAGAAQVFGRLGMGYERAKALLFHALARRAQGHREGVEDELTAAGDGFARCRNRTWVAMIDLHAGAMAAARGEHAVARRRAQGALRVFEAEQLDLRSAMALELLGRVATAEGDTTRAVGELRQARRRARRARSPWAESRALIALARARRRHGQPTQALTDVERALVILERLHVAVPLGRTEAALAPDRAEASAEAVQLCLDLARDGDAEATARAFLHAERSRSQSLLDRLTVGRRLAAGLEPSRAASLRALTRQAWWCRNALHRLDASGSASPLRRRRLERELAQAEREAEAMLRDERRTDSAAHVVGDPVQVLRCLPPDTALLEYVLGETETVLFILDGEGLRVRRLPASRSDVVACLRRLQFQMNAFALGAEHVRRHRTALRRAAEAHLHELGRLLLPGVPEEVTASRWVVVPHDALHHVPFPALRLGSRNLVDLAEVSVAPSASLLRACLAREGRGRGALVMGVATASTPAVVAEARDVAALLGATALTGGSATVDAFRRAAPSARVVHVATHGIFRPDRAMSSALRMDGGWLTLDDVAEHDYEADLVVLSACHAGLDRILSGDEQVGLGRAFLGGGAATLVTTLWAVQDASMAAWMRDFYVASCEGAGPAGAARHAALLARERDPHPHGWAACAVSGRPTGGLGVAGCRPNAAESTFTGASGPRHFSGRGDAATQATGLGGGPPRADTDGTSAGVMHAS
jgi:tetratricopeptide (TPR) repeat protein